VLLIPTAHTCAPISALGVVVQFQSRSGPIDRYQLARCEQRDIRSSQVWTAKADIGGYRIGHRDVLNRFAVWRDHRYATVYQGCDANIARTIYSHRIEQLVAGESGEQCTAARSAQESSSWVLDPPEFSRAGNVLLPDTPLEGLRDVQTLVVRRKSNAVRAVDGIDHLLD
jgi:hypothetical protein